MIRLRRFVNGHRAVIGEFMLRTFVITFLISAAGYAALDTLVRMMVQ